MDNMALIWLCAIIVFVIVEAATAQMLCIWFAAAALVSLVLALFGTPEWAQITAFLVCTAALLIFTRPIVKRLVNNRRTNTNADRILGKQAIVTQEINNYNAEGQIKVISQTWTARSIDGSVIPAGEKVVIRSIEGVKAIVEKKE